MTKEEFTRLAGKYTDTVFRVALNMLKSTSAAEDVCQEVFLRLWKSNKTFESEEHARNWLIRVAINESKRSITSIWNKTESIEEHSEELVFRTPEQSQLFDEVMRLPQKYRIVIYLYYYEGYSSGEIAKLVGLTEAAVRTRLKRGRDSLRDKLTEAEYV